MTDWDALVERVALEQEHRFPDVPLEVHDDDLDEAVRLAPEAWLSDAVTELDVWHSGLTMANVRAIGQKGGEFAKFEDAMFTLTAMYRLAIRDGARAALRADVKEWWERRQGERMTRQDYAEAKGDDDYNRRQEALLWHGNKEPCE